MSKEDVAWVRENLEESEEVNAVIHFHFVHGKIIVCILRIKRNGYMTKSVDIPCNVEDR